MSLINTKISPFNVNAFHKGDFITVSEKDLEGHWSVVVFYPADFTYVCPTELGDLADNYEKFKKIGCEIYSVSTDTHFVHKAWADATETIKKIQYPMLSDPTGKMSEDFEVLVEETWQARRGTFIINPEGFIVAYEVNSDGIGRSSKELFRKVQAAQFVAENGDQVCPANWEPGEKTIIPTTDLIGKI